MSDEEEAQAQRELEDMNNPAFTAELRKKAEKKLELQKRKRIESKNRKDEMIKKLEKGIDYDIE